MKMVNSTLCYIERDDEYPMLHRVKKENDQNKDKWIGVGGKFEQGESPFDCVRREIKEETGLTVEHPVFRGIVTFCLEGWGTEYMHLFTASKYDGVIQDCDEGELAWVKKDEIVNLPIWEGDKIFLDLLAKDVPIFFLTLRYDKNDILLSHSLEFDDFNCKKTPQKSEYNGGGCSGIGKVITEEI